MQNYSNHWLITNPYQAFFPLHVRAFSTNLLSLLKPGLLIYSILPVHTCKMRQTRKQGSCARIVGGVNCLRKKACSNMEYAQTVFKLGKTIKEKYKFRIQENAESLDACG